MLIRQCWIFTRARQSIPVPALSPVTLKIFSEHCFSFFLNLLKFFHVVYSKKCLPQIVDHIFVFWLSILIWSCFWTCSRDRGLCTGGLNVLAAKYAQFLLPITTFWSGDLYGLQENLSRMFFNALQIYIELRWSRCTLYSAEKVLIIEKGNLRYYGRHAWYLNSALCLCNLCIEFLCIKWFDYYLNGRLELCFSMTC